MRDVNIHCDQVTEARRLCNVMLIRNHSLGRLAICCYKLPSTKFWKIRPFWKYNLNIVIMIMIIVLIIIVTTITKKAKMIIIIPVPLKFLVAIRQNLAISHRQVRLLFSLGFQSPRDGVLMKILAGGNVKTQSHKTLRCQKLI